MPATQIRIRNLSKTYGRYRALSAGPVSTVKVLDDISLDVLTGECLALIGRSGGGKSTLGRCILRLVEPESGDIFFNDVNLLSLPEKEFRGLRPRIQMIFQDALLSLNPRMTVAATLTEPLKVLFNFSKKAAIERAEELLKSVGLQPAFLNRLPVELSGGQRQRVAIARALSTNPEFLIADEPTSSLDAKNKKQVVKLLKELQIRYNLTLLLLSHDLSMVSDICDRIAVLHDGNIVEIAATQELFNSPRHAHSRALVSAAVHERQALQQSDGLRCY